MEKLEKFLLNGDGKYAVAQHAEGGSIVTESRRTCDAPGAAVTGDCSSNLGPTDFNYREFGDILVTNQPYQDMLVGSCGVKILQVAPEKRYYEYMSATGQKLQGTKVTCSESGGEDSGGQVCADLNKFTSLFVPHQISLCSMDQTAYPWKKDEICYGKCDDMMIKQQMEIQPYLDIWTDFLEEMANTDAHTFAIAYPCGVAQVSDIGQGMTVSKALVQAAIRLLGRGIKPCDLYINKWSIDYAEQSNEAKPLSCNCGLEVLADIEKLGVKVHLMETIPTYRLDANGNGPVDTHDGTIWAVNGSEFYLVGGIPTLQGCNISSNKLGASVLVLMKPTINYEVQDCNGQKIVGIRTTRLLTILNDCGIVVGKFADDPCCASCGVQANYMQ